LYEKTYIIHYIGQYIAPTTKLFIDGQWLYVWFVYTDLLKRKIKKKKIRFIRLRFYERSNKIMYLFIELQLMIYIWYHKLEFGLANKNLLRSVAVFLKMIDQSLWFWFFMYFVAFIKSVKKYNNFICRQNTCTYRNMITGISV
jgi:hypothetical protein